MDKTERLQCRKQALQEQWELLSSKLSGLELEQIRENRSEEIFRLDQQIAGLKEKRQAVEEELDAIEHQLQAVPAVPPSVSADSSLPVAATEQKRVCLIYKRNAQADERMAALLERELAAVGHSIFIDKHLKVGVEWAKQIAAELVQSDAVIIILSPQSVQSDMLAYEIEIAHQAAQENNAKPRLLPVRIKFEDPLPAELSGKLTALQYTLWRGPEDDERVLRAVMDGITGTLPVPLTRQGRVEMTGGAVPLDSRFYVIRPADEAFAESIDRRDSIVLIKGARQIGKTSLLARGLNQARKNGFQIVLTDFQKLSTAELQSLEAFYLTLGEMLADQLDLDASPEETWKAGRSPNANFERYLCRKVLCADKPLIWAMDEVDRLFSCPFGSEVFALFRSWHNERALNPCTALSHLTLAIAYATEAHLFIRDLNQSPFNVGTRLYLADFTLEQVADLNRRYGSPLRDGAELSHFYQLLGGQPYLVRRGFDELVTRGCGLEELKEKAAQNEGVFGDHLRRILVMLGQDEELCAAVRKLLAGETCPDFETFYRLRSAGVLCGESSKEAVLRCEIYATYLKRHLL